jgi:hypothetical protein
MNDCQLNGKQRAKTYKKEYTILCTNHREVLEESEPQLCNVTHWLHITANKSIKIPTTKIVSTGIKPKIMVEWFALLVSGSKFISGISYPGGCSWHFSCPRKYHDNTQN